MKFIYKNLIWSSLLLLSAALTSCGGKQATTNANDTRPSINVSMATVGNTSAEGYTSLSGKIQAEDYANVSARIMGYLTNVRVEVGDKVSKGQVLASISSDEIKAKQAQADAGIAEAQAALRNIEKDYARIQSLFEKQSATQKELDDITAHKEMTMAKLRQAQEMKNEANTMYSYASIRAPFSGTLTEKHIHSGDLASPGRPLFTIEAAGNFQAQAMIPESQIAQIKKGDQVKVIVKSTGAELKGTISEYSTSSLNTGGQYLAKIDLNKQSIKGQKLFSGMFVNVLMPQKAASSSSAKITVPTKAIVTQGQLTGIYTLSEGGTALLRWIRLGKTYGDQVEVLSGLAQGEQYILSADGRLMNGVKVVTK